MEYTTLDDGRNTHLYLTMAVILLGALAFCVGLAMSASAATLPPWLGGGMNVVGDEYYNDCTSELGDSILVQSGGNLTLDNVTLKFQAGYGIEVRSGGRLYIVDSTIQQNQTGDTWDIYLYQGGTLIIDNSTLDGYDGFTLDDVDANITDNTLTPSSTSVEGIYMWYNLGTFTSDGPVITGNTITQCSVGFNMDSDTATMLNVTLHNNTIASSGDGIQLDITNIVVGNFSISGNDMKDVNGDGIYILAPYAEIYHMAINENVITNLNTYYAIYLDIDYGQFTGNTFEVKGNDIQNTEYGLYIYDSGATWGPITISGNNFDSLNGHFVTFSPYSTTYGGAITISGNSFSNQSSWDESVYFYSSSFSYSSTITGDFTFTGNSFYNTCDGLYLYLSYGDYYGNVTVQDNEWDTIYGRAFYFYYDDGNMGNVSISDNNLTDVSGHGIYLYQSSYQAIGDVSVMNNDLDTVGGYGVVVSSSGADWGNVTIEDNNMTSIDNYNLNLYISSGSVKDINIHRNNIDKNSNYGMRVYASSATSIGKTYFQNNTIRNSDDSGIYIYYYSADHVDDILVVDNVLGATGGWWDDGFYLTASYGVVNNVTVERNIIHGFTDYGFYLNLYSSDVDQVSINSNTLVGNDDGLYVSNAYGTCSKLLIRNNTLVSHYYSGLDLALSYSTNQPIIENNQIVNNGDGIHVTSWGDADLEGGRMANNTMIKNDRGLYIDGSFGLRIEHNKIQSNNQFGVQIWGNWNGDNIVGAMYNNLINNNQVDISLNDGVTLKSYNNTFETVTAQDFSLWPELWVMGMVDVNVLWEDGSGPVGDAELTIEDTLGNLLIDDRTDSGGWYKNIEIIISTYDPNGAIFNTPHWINASKFGITSFNQIEVESETLVTIYLDNLPPAIDVFTPEDFLVTNVLLIKVAGQTEADAVMKINGVQVNLTQSGTFEYFIDLDKEGNNDIRLVAKDRFNNTATLILHITRDTVPPLLEIHTPKEDASVNTPSLLVEGETEPGIVARINEQLVQVDSIGRFSITVLLAEGENTITVAVVDEAGNEVRATRTVHLDSVPPTITVLTPESGLITNVQVIEISGTAVGATMVKVNGMTLKLVGETFVSIYHLQSGTNTLRFEAWDSVCNYAFYEHVVIQDNNPPDLEVISPKDNLFTWNEVLIVGGTSELSNIVTVNGVQVFLDPNNGLFQYTLLLKEGTNRVIVRSMDPIGNTIEIVRNVFLDTTPPILMLTNPGDNMVTSNPKLLVEGIVEKNSELTMNGEVVPVEQGLLRVTIILEEGDNRIVVIATDQAGNMAMEVRTVRLDSQAKVMIYSPPDGLRTNQANITISGCLEPGAILKIDGLDIEVTNDSRFAKSFPLDLGTNDFKIVVTDANGNVMIVYRSVIREEVYIPPKKDVEEGVGTGLDSGILALAIVALIVAVISILMHFMRGKPSVYDRLGPMEEDVDLDEEEEEEGEEEEEDEEEEEEDLPSPPSETKDIPEPAVEGEVSASETKITSLNAKVDQLEAKGADIYQAKQSLRMAKLYLEKNRRSKAEKQIQKAKQILAELEAEGNKEETKGPATSDNPSSGKERRIKEVTKEGDAK